MDPVKAEERYEVALSLLSELKEEQSVPTLFKVVRHVFAINTVARQMADKDSVSTWKKRIDDLHGQLASLVAKFLQKFNQTKEDFGNACLSLLYVGAETCERLEQEKETLLTQLTIEREKYVELDKRFQTQLQDSALKENLELRTRLVVQQQNTIQREHETRKLMQQLQKTLLEKNDLLVEKERLAEERARNLQILERQATAISQLMDECENNVKEKDQALKSLKTINEDNKILTVNLERHSKVIENLINVNADMIESANSYSQMQDWDERHPKEIQHLPIDRSDENSSCAPEKLLSSSDISKNRTIIPDHTFEAAHKAKRKVHHTAGLHHPTFC